MTNPPPVVSPRKGTVRMRIGDLCEIRARQVDPRQPEFACLPHVSGENIESGSGRLMGVRTAGEDGMISGKYAFEAGDVLYSKLRPYLRKAAVAPFAGVCSADMYPLRVDPSRVDSRYLFWLLLSEGFTRYAENESRRSRMPKLNRDQLFAFETLVPPIAEQRRVAALLDDQMEIAERAKMAARAAREASGALEHARLRQVFHDTCPLTADASVRPAPPGWRWRLLTDLARLETGHTPSRSRPDWWGGSIPWLALPDIRRLDGRTAEQTLEFTNAEGIANSAARVLPAGTVVLSRTASIGFVTVLGREMATSQDFVNWVCGPDLEPWFLAHLLRASRQVLLFLGSGAVHKTVYFPTVAAFRVCIPDVETQRRIAAVLGEHLAQAARVTASLDAELERLDALPSSLLRCAFSEGA